MRRAFRPISRRLFRRSKPRSHGSGAGCMASFGTDGGWSACRNFRRCPMKPFALIAALALAASPVLALDLTTDTQLGSTPDEIRTSLKDLGYDVRKIEDEDGKIEAYVVKDGKMAEVYVDPKTGKISKIEME
ncbi:hypothetical protein SPO0274 [Ruegeria pomeroyi DSS-3]|uniref:PepSY domain-containing protein n=2 Tax=Ruegeria pomeroyi TaxID=89184 RepID=Q5LX53_RUEPO|nr:hypothetical protein SPO0274 [Ruegeria pomeroyi DSS-3]